VTLIVGLGNPTQTYANTRHNIGFMVIDALVGDHTVTSVSKPQFKGELFKSSQTLFLKPHTYMNLSGESVRAVCDYFKPDLVVVIHDDLDLDLGVVRFKTGGGHGGHNGLKSIDQHIGSAYFRMRLGIGKPAQKSAVVSYVLQGFKAEELPCLKQVISHGASAMVALQKSSPEEVTAAFTCKKGVCAP